MTKNLKYYRIRFGLVSPLSIGSGEDASTDSDVILDSRSLPMIPASSFAGAVRHYLGVSADDKDNFFGYIDNNKAVRSKVIFYDCELVSDSFITVRDSVALENKVGIDGAKFDFEAVESNAEFISLIQLENAEDDDEARILEALSAFDSGTLRLGSKSSRGYGQIKICSIEKAVFSLPDDKEKWLSFDQYDYSSDTNFISVNLPEITGKFIRIHLELSQKGAVSIRSYTVKDPDVINSSDYIQLSLHDGTPVIPGTSWAGAFRERFSKFAGESRTKELFGYVDTSNKKQSKSKICFSESRISGHEMKNITRNSIDRFSAGTKDKALYSERTCYNGKCALDIDIAKDISDLNNKLKYISAVICDLDKGYLAVGGLTSVGRGLFEITNISVDGSDVTDYLKKCDISGMTGGIS